MTMYIDNSKLKVHISLWLGSMFWLISIMIIVGGLTRLTDSGLSITKRKYLNLNYKIIL